MNDLNVWVPGAARYNAWTSCGRCAVIIRSFDRNFFGWTPKQHILFKKDIV